MSTALVVGTNTYISLADAETYFDNILNNETWNCTTTNRKNIALMSATKNIDKLKLRGMKAVSTQTLKFPRAIYNAFNTSHRYFYDNYFTIYENWYIETSVQQSVLDAVCEEAQELLVSKSKRLSLQEQGVKAFKLGNLSETFVTRSTSNLILSSTAKEYLTPYLARSVIVI